MNKQKMHGIIMSAVHGTFGEVRAELGGCATWEELNDFMRESSIIAGQGAQRVDHSKQGIKILRLLSLVSVDGNTDDEMARIMTRIVDTIAKADIHRWLTRRYFEINASWDPRTEFGMVKDMMLDALNERVVEDTKMYGEDFAKAIFKEESDG
jgi:hypothetical protein